MTCLFSCRQGIVVPTSTSLASRQIDRSKAGRNRVSANMYKSRLQELCQAKQWSLPNYSTSRDGPDHAPRFKASIVVNGVSFESSDRCKSSKEAQNEVARYAYEHFVKTEQRVELAPTPGSAASLPTLSSSSASVSAGPSTTKCLLNNIHIEKEGMSQRNPNISESPGIHVNGSSNKDLTKHGELQHIYKSKLQNYAQTRNIKLPIYSYQQMGPPHAVHFKASVTIDGKTFESPEFFRTLKDAEHAAAKVALLSLSEDGMQEEDSSVYKNLLQAWVQKEGFPLPSYVTAFSGPSHLPTFISTVEIEGESFQGAAAKTKKQAESYAAKVAYCSLEECRLSRKPLIHHSNQANKSQERTPSNSIVIVDFQNILECGDSLNSKGLKYDKWSEESEAMNQEAETFTASASSLQTLSKPAPSLISINEDSSDTLYASLRDPFPSGPASTEDGQSSSPSASESSNDAIAISNYDLLMESQVSLPCTKVQVFPCVPGIELPEGTTVLPISDDKWVAVSSSFPNQQGENKYKGKQIVK